MFNPFDRPAHLLRRSMPRTPNPLADVPPMERACDAFMAELTRIHEVLLACDRGEYQGPRGIDSRYFLTICFESHEQRDAFRKAMHLEHHGEQYWTAEAFLGSLEWLETHENGSSFAKRHNPFAKATPAPKEAEESKYSRLREEAKRTREKLALYTDSQTWIAICFGSQTELENFRKEFDLPQGQYVHCEDIIATIQRKFKITLAVPSVEFGLRATHRPDAALTSLVRG